MTALDRWQRPELVDGVWTVPTFAEPLCRSCANYWFEGTERCRVVPRCVPTFYTCRLYEGEPGLQELWEPPEAR